MGLRWLESHVDDFLYDIACTDENWFKNRTSKHLPRKLRTFSIDIVHLQLTVLKYTSILIVFIPIMSVLIIFMFFYVM